MSMAEQYEYLRTRLVSRRTLVTAGAVAGGGLLAGCAKKSASPTPATSAVRAHGRGAWRQGRPRGPGRRLDRPDAGRDRVRHGGRDLYSFPSGIEDSYEGHVTRHGAVRSFHWTEGQHNVAETVEWSRVRYTGFSFLKVEAAAGTTPRLSVSAPAQSGARIDHFEIRPGG
jgi:hypothetical protein